VISRLRYVQVDPLSLSKISASFLRLWKNIREKYC